MKKIRIVKVEEIKYKNKKLKLINDFFIETNKPYFYINVELDVFSIFDDNLDKIGKIICYTKTNKPITLLDCSIAPTTSKKTNFQIVYNNIIIGEKVESLNDIKIKNLHINVKHPKLNYHIWIGKDAYFIDNNFIKVETKRNEKRQGSVTKINGVKFILKSKKMVDYFYLSESFFRLLIIYYFYIGYFPKEYEIYFYKNGRKVEIKNPNDTIFKTSSKYVTIEKVMCNDKLNYGIAYDEFSKIYEINKMLFHLYFSINYNEDNFEEIRTFNYIQCLESLFTNIKKVKTEENNDSIKNILSYLKNEIDDESSNIRNEVDQFIINEKDKNKIIENIKNILDNNIKRLSELSFSKLVKKIFELDETKLIFKYEYDNDYIKIIEKKVYNHRNLFAHISKNSNYFNEIQNRIVQTKFDILFRLLVLKSIKLEVNHERLLEYIKYVDNHYYKNDINNNIWN